MSWTSIIAALLFTKTIMGNKQIGKQSDENTMIKDVWEPSKWKFPLEMFPAGGSLVIKCPKAKHVVISLNDIVITTHKMIGDKFAKFENNSNVASILYMNLTGPAVVATIQPHVSGSLTCSDLEFPDIFTEKHILLRDHIKLEIYLEVSKIRKLIPPGASCFVDRFEDVRVEVKITAERGNRNNCWVKGKDARICSEVEIPYLPVTKPGNVKVFYFGLNDFVDSQFITFNISCFAHFGNSETNSFVIQSTDYLVFMNQEQHNDHPPNSTSKNDTLIRKNGPVKRTNLEARREIDKVLTGFLISVVLCVITITGVIISCCNMRGLTHILYLLEKKGRTIEESTRV